MDNNGLAEGPPFDGEKSIRWNSGGIEGNRAAFEAGVLDNGPLDRFIGRALDRLNSMSHHINRINRRSFCGGTGLITREVGGTTLSLPERPSLAGEAGFDGVDFDKAGADTREQMQKAFGL